MKGTNILATIVVLFGLFYFIFADEFSQTLWFRCTAFEHFLQSLLCYVLANKLNNGYLKMVTQFTALITLSNYLDEIWFDPYKIQLNAIIFSIIAVITVYIRNAKQIHRNIKCHKRGIREK